MEMNSKMKALLREGKIGVPGSPISLNNNLKNIADSKLVEIEGCYFLEALFHKEYDIKNALDQDDRTGIECEINNLYIQTILYTNPCTEVMDAITVLSQGIVYAYYLADKLKVVGHFRIIFSIVLEEGTIGNIDCCVRFHLIRTGENWLCENLEDYTEEAIFVLST